MNTKNNQRTRLTKLLFRSAMTELLESKKSIDKISIKEICEKAELNRSTFYAYYSRPEDLLREIENEITASTLEHMHKEANEDDPRKAVLSFLRYIKNNDRLFRVFLAENPDPEFSASYFSRSLQFIKTLGITFSEDEAPFIYAYILSGSAGIIIEWIRSDYSASEEYITDLLFSLNSNAIFNINA